MSSVLQQWTQNLTYIQQSVLITATRGPDTIQKKHVVKTILCWMRRCYLISAFDKEVLTDPYDTRGGSFTGPCEIDIHEAVNQYLKSIDEIPLHFHTHLMHAVEILGYEHPEKWIADFWKDFYYRIVKGLHLNPESKEQMRKRLSDSKDNWLEAEKIL